MTMHKKRAALRGRPVFGVFGSDTFFDNVVEKIDDAV